MSKDPSHSTSQQVCSDWFGVDLCFHCSDLCANNYLTWNNVQAYWFNFLPTIRHLHFFTWPIFCPVVKSCLILEICCWLTLSASFSGALSGCRTPAWGFVEKIAARALQLQAPQEPFWRKPVHASWQEEPQESENWWLKILTYNMYLVWGNTVCWSLHKFMWSLYKFDISMKWLWEFSPLSIHSAIIDDSIL